MLADSGAARGARTFKKFRDLVLLEHTTASDPDTWEQCLVATPVAAVAQKRSNRAVGGVPTDKSAPRRSRTCRTRERACHRHVVSGRRGRIKSSVLQGLHATVVRNRRRLRRTRRGW